MSRLRILLVSHVPPWPPTSGGRQRMHLLWSALTEVGDVDLLLLSPELAPDENAAVAELRSTYGLVDIIRRTRHVANPGHRRNPRQAVRWLLYRWRRFSRPPAPEPEFAAGLERCLARHQYGLVCVFQLSNLWSSAAGRHARVVVDVDDLMFEVFERRARVTSKWSPRHWLYRWKAGKAREWTLRSTLEVSHFFVAKPEDRQFFGDSRATLLRNVPFHEPTCLQFESTEPDRGRMVVLIVASLGYHPNVDGVDHFLRQIWPSLAGRYPSAVLRIVGSGLPDSIGRKWASRPQVELAGFADELREEYARALFCVVPVRYGAGTNIKFVEAMAFGRTVVATSKGAAGYEGLFDAGEHYLLGDTDAEFLAACDRLLADPGRARDMGRTAFDALSRTHSRAEFIHIAAAGAAAALGRIPDAPSETL